MDTDAPTTEISDEELLWLFRGYPVDHDTAAHYRGRLQRRLLINRCASCGTWHYPPRPVCPSCLSDHVVATPVSGRGTIYMVVFLHQGPPVEGIDYRSRPYPIVTVELDEQPGLRFSSTVASSPNEEIQIGRRVHLDWTTGAEFPCRCSASTTGWNHDELSQPDEGSRGHRRRRHDGISPDQHVSDPGQLRGRSGDPVLDLCGLSSRDVDGLCGSLPAAPAVQSMLGIPEITWFANPTIPIGNHLAAAASAVYSGLCELVLVYHGSYRMAWNTGSAAEGPLPAGGRRFRK